MPVVSSILTVIAFLATGGLVAVAYVVLVPLMSLLVARRTARRLAQEKNGKQLSP